MSNNYKNLYRKLPPPVGMLLMLSKGWLVGSSIDSVLKGEKPRDYDIIVTDPQYWGVAVKYASESTKTMGFNTFGGLKFTIEGSDIEIDMWPQDLERFLHSRVHGNKLYNLSNQILINIG